MELELGSDEIDLELAESSAIHAAKEVFCAVVVGELQYELEILAEAAINKEYSAIEKNPNMDRKRLLKIERIKNQFAAFIEASEAMVEGVEFLTGKSVRELLNAEWTGRIVNEVQP
jgi:hypothetical protein